VRAKQQHSKREHGSATAEIKDQENQHTRKASLGVASLRRVARDDFSKFTPARWN
jgi:hypothetical protein